jgi:hypothetical protein
MQTKELPPLEKRMSQAVGLLQEPQVRAAPRKTRIKYMQKQCALSAEEVHTAFKEAYGAAKSAPVGSGAFEHLCV